MINLGSAYGEIQLGTGQAEANVASLANKLRSTGQAMSLALTAPLVGLAATGAMAAASFEQSLNQMEVISGATADQMQQLSDTALQLGQDTSFSAGEAAAGMLELAKAGMSTEEVLASITGTLDLAAAAGMSVAQAAEVSANALNMFGLDASEAGRVADLLAAAANSSSVEITDMAAALQMSGAVFAANKVPIEDLSTAIALLGNNGIKGSDAGTSLKTMLMRLTAPTDEAATALRALGIQIYNADGSMRSFQSIVGQLEVATASLTAEQRNQALTTLFGADAIRAANILVGEGAIAFAQMKSAVTEAGAAQEVADAKLKGLAGAIEYAKGTIESTLISAVLPFLDGMSGLIRQGADLIAMFTSLPAPVQNAALAFAAVLAVAGPVMLAISGIATALGFLLSPIGLVVVGVALLAAAWTSNFMGIQEATAAAWAAIQPVLEGMPALFAPVQEAAASAVAGIQASWGEMLPGILATVQGAWEQLMALLEPAMTRLQAAFQQAQVDVGALAPKFAELWAAVQNMWTAVQPILEMLAQVFAAEIAITAVVAVNLLAQAFTALGSVAGVVLDQITLALNTFAALITEVITLIKALIAGDYTAAWQSAQNIVQIFANFWKRTFDNMRLLVETVFIAIKTAVLDTLKDLNVDGSAIMETIKAWWDSIWGGFRTVIDPIVGAINGILDAMNALSSMNFKPPWEGLTPPSWWNPGGWFGGGGGELGQNAMGTSYWRGGLTWVGENGPELVDVPRGARILDNQDSQRMNGRTFNITVPVQQLSSQLDMTELAYRVAGMIMQYEGAA